jgi:hypothetical protein
MNDYYIEEIIKLLGILSHKAVKRIYHYIVRLSKKELDS